MTGRVINPVRTPFSPSSVCQMAAGCLGLCLCCLFGTGSIFAQQSGFQTDGTPIYPALPVPPTGVPPVTSPAQAPAPGVVPGQPVAPGMAPAPAPAANPDYPQLVYPPVYSPETVPARPPRAMPVPEKKGKFGLFGKRKDKGRDDDDVPAPRTMESDQARVYPDPSAAYPQGQGQGQMQPRPGFDPNYPPGAVPPATDAYGRPVNPGAYTATAPQQGMQSRPSLDSRYPVYTTQPAVPPAYPAPGSDPGASTLPPLPDSPSSMQTAQPPAYPQGTYPQTNSPAPTTPPPAGVYGNSGGSLAQAPAGPSMPPSDAPIFRREPVLEPAPAPATAQGGGANAPIFRTTPPSSPTPPTQTPPATGSGSQWETARTGGGTSMGGSPATGSSTGSRQSGTGLPAPRNETPPAPPKPEASEFANLPFAKPVPGKVGFVTVSTYSGEIDVRGIAPGTPVEIPDPSDGTKTIQFRVP